MSARKGNAQPWGVRLPDGTLHRVSLGPGQAELVGYIAARPGSTRLDAATEGHLELGLNWPSRLAAAKRSGVAILSNRVPVDTSVGRTSWAAYQLRHPVEPLQPDLFATEKGPVQPGRP